ncbi:MAG: YXWGXW repeat-containing protein [Usitatibacter sp.]
MKTIQKALYAGFAACALASTSLPAFSFNTTPDVDFEWYANVGRSPGNAEIMPAPRAGYIWAPGHYEWTGTRQVWAKGVWVRDEQSPHWTAFKSSPNTISYTTGPTELHDVDGNVIPTDPNAYNVDSARR